MVIGLIGVIKFLSPLFLFGIAVIVIIICIILFTENCKIVELTREDFCELDKKWKPIVQNDCIPPIVIADHSDPTEEVGPSIHMAKFMEKCTSAWGI